MARWPISYFAIGEHVIGSIAASDHVFNGGEVGASPTCPPAVAGSDQVRRATWPVSPPTPTRSLWKGAEMHAVVLYESLFGNTRDIALAVAAGVRTAWPNAAVDC